MLQRIKNSIAWRFAKFRGFPDKLHIETTSRCNLDCEYCVLRDNYTEHSTMTLEQFSRFQPYFRHANRITLSGLAEPLMNPNIVDFIKLVKAANPACSVAIFTNAMLLNNTKSQELIDAGLNELAFSLDGVSPDAVNQVRSGGNFTKMLENISCFNNLIKGKDQLKPVISAVTVLRRDNLQEMPGIIELAGKIGVKTLSFNGLEPYSDEMSKNILWDSTTYPDNLRSILEQAITASKKSCVTIKSAALSPQTPCCTEPLFPMILPNGDVTICSALAYPRPCVIQINQDASLQKEPGTVEAKIFGNAFKTKLIKILNSKKYKEFKHAVLSGRFPPQCSKCLIKHQIICVRQHKTLANLLKELSHD